MGSEPYFEDGPDGWVCREVIETDKPTHSELLGPDGLPLPYNPNPVGFDLRPKHQIHDGGKSDG